MITTKEKQLFHEKFGALHVDEGFGVLVYEPKKENIVFEIGDSCTNEELDFLRIKSLVDNFDYVYERVKNNKKLIYESDYVY